MSHERHEAPKMDQELKPENPSDSFKFVRLRAGPKRPGQTGLNSRPGTKSFLKPVALGDTT